MYKCLNPRTIGITLAWEGCLPLARGNGFGGIDLPIDPQVSASHYREALERYRLKPGGMSLPFHMTEDDPKVDMAMANLPAICERARDVGQTRFYTWILPFSEALPWKDNFSFHAVRLGKAARILEEYGCRLGLEFIGPRTVREGHKYSFVHTLEQMLDLCEAVGPNAGLLLDAYHWYTSLGIVEELLILDDRQVVYVHVNDAPAGIPIEQQQDLVRCLPGDSGVIDLPGFLQALHTIGYKGPVVPEPFVKELHELTPAEAAGRAGEAMQRVWMYLPRSANQTSGY
ncbi:MAG: sugar phosphate isomerase/epimerase family protein [Omnitrophica WOR_2 bacterium]